MNKTPIAAGLAMIMGISVVFAFDRVKPIEGTPQNSLSMSVQAQTLEVDNNSVSSHGIEANILMDEAPLILESSDQQRAIGDAANKGKLAAAENLQQDKGHRSLKLALADMQQALERLEREAELTHRAVAMLEQNYQ